MPRFRRRTRRLLTKKSKNLEGLPEVFEKLNDMADMIDGEEIIEVLMKGAELGRDEIKDTAPSGTEEHPPGRLKIRDATFAARGKPERDAKGPSVLFGVNARRAPQAIWTEFGFFHIAWPKKGRYRRSNPNLPGETIPPRPFFRPAITAVRPAIANRLSEGLRGLIAKVTGT